MKSSWQQATPDDNGCQMHLDSILMMTR